MNDLDTKLFIIIIVIVILVVITFKWGMHEGEYRGQMKVYKEINKQLSEANERLKNKLLCKRINKNEDEDIL